MDNGWIGLHDGPIAAEDAPVIVWHVHQGVMVYQREAVSSNRFLTHWREIDNGAWIDTGICKPTKQDADALDCVISLNKWGDVSMAGWHRFEHEDDLIRWQRPPDPPDNFSELQNIT